MYTSSNSSGIHNHLMTFDDGISNPLNGLDKVMMVGMRFNEFEVTHSSHTSFARAIVQYLNARLDRLHGNNFREI
ncbi:hypothetical protein E6P70_07020 [Moraxella nonliquefaciens]|uniref:hypothetical protein n=1 Tax=Moraxella nonliquefaciens TaxID=478 RepID=UPI0024A61DA3|nr:hypothetical protein [Moraxella nonliquefaciens]MDI4498497.1 hypothetical protein [Moraxella nonliquefaciens]MDI4500351.1 hypothetical protein [Moraxella nonliquefaciens]